MRQTVPQIAGNNECNLLLIVLGYLFVSIYLCKILLGMGACSKVFENAVEQGTEQLT
jgi:hypothetical protein